MRAGEEVTALLLRYGEGDQEALNALFDVLYDELHRLAEGQRVRWEGSYTLDTTSLVHEAYLKLVDQTRASWNDRNHFLAVAARAMRHILINYAEAKKAAKRGGGKEPLSLDKANPLTDEAAEEILDLHEALERLEAEHERAAKVVEARFFGGFTVEDTAQLLGTSPATVKRDWTLACAWLRRELGTSPC